MCLNNRNIYFRSRGLASGIAAAGSYILAFVASRTFLPLKSVLCLYGVFWLYGCLGFIGFFVIYWTFSETEGRSLEDIEEFYKNGFRGKIPKRVISKGLSKESSTNLNSSTNFVTVEKENEANISDEDRMINNTLFATQRLSNRPSKLYSSNDISSEIVSTSTETLDTTVTASTADLQGQNLSTGDVREKDDVDTQVAEERPEEVKVGEKLDDKREEKEERYNKVESKSKSSASKAVEGKRNEENCGDKEGENHFQEKVDIHKEADVEDRTKM